MATNTIGPSAFLSTNLNNRIMGSGAALGSAMAGTPGTIAGTIAGALLSPKMEKEGGRIAQKLMEKSQGIRTPSLSPIPEATQRGFQIQQGAQRGLLDQFLTENAGEVRRRRDMKSKFQQDNQNRVGK